MNNLDWARSIVDALALGGAGCFVYSPGARNLPLLVSLDERRDLACEPCLDERAAGFLAVGWMRGRAAAGGGLVPAVVVCTSGTATLNLLPAVAEAREAGLPLVVLSADRPAHELGLGANQTIDQVGPMRPLLAAQLTLETPASETLAALPARVGRALAAARATPGPLQINVPFGEPLLGDAAGGVPASGPELLRQPTPQRLSAWEVDWWAAHPARASRGLVWACDLPRLEDRRAASALSRLLGWPLLADAGSGLWRRETDPSLPPSIRQGEACLEALAKADFVLQLGKRPVSRLLCAGLAHVEGLVVDEHVGRQDPAGAGWQRWRRRPAELQAALDLQDWPLPPKNPDWCATLRHAGEDAACRQVLALAGQIALTEAGVARRLALHWPADWGLFAGNSLPVRLLDQWLPGLEHDGAAATNRGMSGIDGLLAAAQGFQMGLGRPVAALLGDLSLLHDLSSLALLAQRRPPLLLVVLNNGGGGIFRLHPATSDHAHAWWSHDLELAPLIRGLGLECAQPARLSDLDLVLEDVRQRPRTLVVECRVDGGDHGRRAHAARQARIVAVEGRAAEPPRVLLHGFLGHPDDWSPMLGGLPAASRQLLPALPGHGLQPEPVPPGLAGWRDWLLNLLAELPPVDLIGYSLGGRLALLAALAAPERVRRLVLVGAGPGLESASERLVRRTADEELARRLEVGGLEAFVGEWYRQALFAPLMERPSAVRVLQRRREGDAASLAAVLRAVSPGGQENLWPRLAELGMPVLWVAGSRDTRYAAQAKRAAARCPMGRWTLIPCAGHAVHLEEAANLGERIARWLRDADAVLGHRQDG